MEVGLIVTVNCWKWNNKMDWFNLAIIMLLSVTRLLNYQLMYLEETDLARTAEPRVFLGRPLSTWLLITFLRRWSNCELNEEEAKSYLLFLWGGFSLESGSGCGRPVQISPCGGRRKKRGRLRSEWVTWCWRVTGEGKPHGKLGRREGRFFFPLFW